MAVLPGGLHPLPNRGCRGATVLFTPISKRLNSPFKPNPPRLSDEFQNKATRNIDDTLNRSNRLSSCCANSVSRVNRFRERLAL